ncbi:hypothetical protein [Cognatilysobacter lacus]|uniref:hypothetical protein n=1 Tax=Cognatilysobacter lacus TaxID=1643323 RepID=UPI001658D261|nr:hypothetical protein [Lysobacter lacus]
MSPRYIAPRRADGGPSPHLTARQLQRMRRRFQHLLAITSLCLLTAACVVR